MKTPSSQALGIYRDIDHIVVSRRQIAARVAELAHEIAIAYEGKVITLLGVLTGAMIFVADLIRCMPIPVRLDVLSCCSYPGQATQSQGTKIIQPLPEGLSGKHVLIVDDVLDSGGTITELCREASNLNPATLRTCVLLRKVNPQRPAAVEADFVGFDVGQEFLVGYGLDFDNLYRNLPDICVLRRHAKSSAGGQS